MIYFRYLANSSHAHLWTESNVESLVTFARSTSSPGPLIGSLSVLGDIVQHTSIDKLNLESSESSIIKLCMDCCYHGDVKVVVQATRLLADLAVSCKKDMHHIDGN